MTHSLFLRHEFFLKLLSVIDGYIVAADQKAPLLVYLAVDAKKDPANVRRVKFNSKERRGLSRRHRITPRLGISPMRRAGAKLSSRQLTATFARPPSPTNSAFSPDRHALDLQSASARGRRTPGCRRLCSGERRPQESAPGWRFRRGKIRHRILVSVGLAEGEEPRTNTL